VTNRNEEIR